MTARPPPQLMVADTGALPWRSAGEKVATCPLNGWPATIEMGPTWTANRHLRSKDSTWAVTLDGRYARPSRGARQPSSAKESRTFIAGRTPFRDLTYPEPSPDR